jgi:hypothetical protein
LLLPPVELKLVLLELELEELSLVPTTTPDADLDAGVAKASTTFLEPPSVSGESLSPSVSLSVIVESDESELISLSVFFLSSSCLLL